MICLATGAISKDTKAFTIQNKIIISQGPGEKPNPKIVNLILSQLWEFRSFDTGVWCRQKKWRQGKATYWLAPRSTCSCPFVSALKLKLVGTKAKKFQDQTRGNI